MFKSVNWIFTFTDLEGMKTKHTYHQVIQNTLKDYFSKKYSQQTQVNKIFQLPMHSKTRLK